MNLDFGQKIVLENERVKLSQLTWKHFDALLSIAVKDPFILKYSPPKFGSAENLTTYFEGAFALMKNEMRYPFVVYDKKLRAYAGSTSYLNVSNHNRRIEIGSTWLGRDFQRTGLNRSCKYLLFHYAFEILEFERIELKTDSRNWQSRTAIEGIGGQYEGELRSHTLMSDGFRRNTVYYSILRDEWPKLKTDIFNK